MEDGGTVLLVVTDSIARPRTESIGVYIFIYFDGDNSSNSNNAKVISIHSYTKADRIESIYGGRRRESSTHLLGVALSHYYCYLYQYNYYNNKRNRLIDLY